MAKTEFHIRQAESFSREENEIFRLGKHRFPPRKTSFSALENALLERKRIPRKQSLVEISTCLLFHNEFFPFSDKDSRFRSASYLATLKVIENGGLFGGKGSTDGIDNMLF